MASISERECVECGQLFVGHRNYCSTECFDADEPYDHGVLYTICCRTCEHEFEVTQHIGEDIPPCEECGSDDTYRAITQAPPVELRQQAGGSGWALNGYSNDGYRHYDLDNRGGDDPLKSAAKNTTHGGSSKYPFKGG